MNKHFISRLIDKIVEIGILLFLIILPFFSAVDYRLSIGIVGLCCGVFFLIFIVRYTPGDCRLLRINAPTLVISIFALWLVLSSFWSKYIDASITYNIVFVSSAILFILCMVNFQEDNKAVLLAKFIWLSSFILSLVIILIPLSNTRLNPVVYNLLNSNFFCSYLGLVMPISLALMFTAKKKLKLLYLASFILVFYVALLTRDRGGWIQIIITLIILFSLLFLLRLIKRQWIIFVVVLLIVWMVSFFGAREVVEKFLPQNTNVVKAVTASQRLSIWKSTVMLIKEHPFVGTGIGTFSVCYPKAREGIVNFVNFTHNSYLQITQETGFVGAGLLIILFIWALFSGFSFVKHSEDRKSKIIYAAILAACLGFLIQELYEFNIYMPLNSVILFIFLSILSQKAALLYLDKAKFLRSTYFLFCLLFFMLGGIFLYLSFAFTQSIYFENQAEKYLNNNNDPLAELSYKNAIAYQPTNSYLYRDLSRIYFRQARYKFLTKEEKNDKAVEAIDLLDKSIKLNPQWAEFYIDMADLYLFVKDEFMARSNIEKAITLDPANAFLWDMSGFLYFRQDKYPEARSAFLKAQELNNDDAVAKYYLESFLSTSSAQSENK